MTTQTLNSVYVHLPSGPDTRAYAFNEPDIGALREHPYVEPWRDRSERDYLDRSRRDATRGERSAAEQALWEQVSAKAAPAAQPSAKLQSDWQKLQASLNRQRLLEEKLFSQVAASGFQPE